MEEERKPEEEMQVQATGDIKMAELKEEMEKVEEEKVEKEKVEKEKVEKEEKVEVAAWRNIFLLAACSRKVFHHGYQDRLQNFTTNSFKVYH